MEGAVLCAANHAPLTPISFLERSALVYPDRPAVVSAAGDAPPRTWRETRTRCLRLAAALVSLGVQRRDVVAVFAQNIPAMCELHFGVPMAGAVICALNSRLDAAMAAVLLRHSEAKVIFVDAALLGVAQEALRLVSAAGARAPFAVLITQLLDDAYDSPQPPPSSGLRIEYEYEALVSRGGGSPEFAIRWPADENEPIALNYTSGTTSRPKGVIYSHRGAYLNSLAAVLLSDMPSMPVYLWTVPMFHCNGWCMSWGVAAQGGTSICLRKVTGAAIFDAVFRHGVTHMGGAPTVLSMIINAAPEDRRPLPAGKKVSVMTGGAPPPPTVLFRMEELGFPVTHSYGLTETYGPATVCAWMPEWDALPAEERAVIKARQGLNHLGLEVDVKDPTTMRSVPADGETMGEVMEFCRGRLPRYMAPRTVVIVDSLPKTATGKVQKFTLREKAKAMGSVSTASRPLPGGGGRSTSKL
ncbi:unnamed protein product [Alopecurus aequalis]